MAKFMRNLICFTFIWFVWVCTAANTDTITALGELAFKISPMKYGIHVEYDGESAQTGPIAFSVLGDKLALLGANMKEIVIIDKNGEIAKRIRFKKEIGHFDLDSNGNGFASIEDSLYKIDSFIPAKNGIKTRFTLKGNVEGRFRIDLLKDNAVRFISYAPDFIVEALRDSVNKVITRPKSKIDSVVVNQMSLYVGFYNNYHVFLDYNQIGPNKLPYFKLFAFSIQDSTITYSKKFNSIGQNIGCPIMWSYWSRMDESNGCFYVMLFDGKNVDIRRFDLQKLLGI